MNHEILVFKMMTPEVSKAVQELGFEFGVEWSSVGPQPLRFDTIVFNIDGKLQFDAFTTAFTLVHRDWTSITHSHVERFKIWLLKNVGKRQDNNSTITHNNLITATTTTQQLPPKPTTTMTPYETMVEDIKNRLLQHLETSLPNEGKIKEFIAAETAKYNKTTIVIEDRKKSPPETKEITEAVHKAMPELLGVIQSECWAAIVGPTGGGKTLGVLQVAKILEIPLVCIKQMTRIIAPHDLIGYMDANGHYRKGAWTDAILGYIYENNGSHPKEVTHTPALIVVDEMDNANENIIMVIKALQTGRIAMPYGMQEVNSKLLVVATMNTWGTGATREYVGRCAQDAALLNEFQFIEWNYDTDFEWTLLQNLFNTYKSTGDYEITHMRRLMDMFISMRSKAEAQKVRVIISTRNIIAVAKMLICNPKWSISSTLQKSVFKGLKDDEVKRIESPEHWLSMQEQKKIEEKRRKYPQTTVASNNEECPI